MTDPYARILREIEETLQRCGRPAGSVKLLAVTKGQPADAILKLWEQGQRHFGENYVQEWKKKKEEIERETGSPSPIHWHFTGRLQSNKVKELVGAIDFFHSIDRTSLAEKINQTAAQRGVICRGFVEVSLAGEENKGGIACEKLEEFIASLNPLTHLKIVGLMGMPPLAEEAEQARPYFRKLREILFDLNRKSLYREPLTELSMGMSHDFKVAIVEGATWVRVGRALFSPS
ncbi:MAG: YggS family pyridoxal phosphate-dependent enzyme [bacterium]